jgi:hypothetical protein
LASSVFALSVLVVAGGIRDGTAFALPPAGTDTVNVVGQVSITGRTGQETIGLSGTATIQRATPHTKGSVEASNAELTALNLTGTSVTGPVTVTESPSLVSSGELRSISGTEFPATSFFDVFVVVTMPAAPNPTITLHNTIPLDFNNSSLAGWPPYNAVYTAAHSPCVLLQPAVQNPAQTCITSASMTLTAAGVGGVSHLSGLQPAAENVTKDRTPNDEAAGFGVALALLATFGCVATYARAKLRART